MIPLRDTIPSRRPPVVNVLLIIANVLAFLFELSLGPKLSQFIGVVAAVPAKIVFAFEQGTISIQNFVPIVTSMFLHGGWLHLGGNMLYLWIFGDNVEDKMGHGRYLAFYLLCGIGATALHIYMEPSSHTPIVGASGAIAGVLGAYFLLFPQSKVLTLVPIWFFLQVVELPALIFIGFWFVMQFFYGIFSLGFEEIGGGVAWWAHVGGFATGMVLVYPFRKYR